MEFLAKSPKNGSIGLIDHSVATCNLSVYMFKHMTQNGLNWQSDVPYSSVVNKVVKCALFHDIGKATRQFQSFLDGGKEPKYKHNVVSWAFLSNYTNLDADVLRTILYHHPSECDGVTQSDVCSYYADDEDGMLSTISQLMDIARDRYGVDDIIISRSDKEERVEYVPFYPKARGTEVKELDKLVVSHFLRAVLVCADRSVSKLTESMPRFLDMDESFLKDLADSMTEIDHDNPIEKVCFQSIPFYDNEKTKRQDEYLSELIGHTNSILKLDTGGGKTMLSLRWWGISHKRLVYAAPNISVAKNTYTEFENILRNIGLSDAVSVALVIGGEYMEGYEGCDITVCVIDSLLGRNTRNNIAHELFASFECDMVFDEYQMYTMDKALFSSFITLVGARLRFTPSRTLLMSATVPMYHGKFFGPTIALVDCGVLDKDKAITIKYEESDGLESIRLDKDTIAILNTVRNSQDMFSSLGLGDDGILLHTQFMERDKNGHLDEVFANRGRNSDISARKTVVGTDVIGVGVNVSAEHICDVVKTPEDTVQRCGRGNRFGEYGKESVKLHCIRLTDKSSRRFSRLLLGDKGMPIVDKWTEVLRCHDGDTMTKEAFCAMYDDFVKGNKKLYSAYYDASFIASSEAYSSLRPYKTYTRGDDDVHVLSSRDTFRGMNNSIFVMARYADGRLIEEPMELSTDKIGDGESDDDALKAQYEYFKSCLPSATLRYAYQVKCSADVKQARFKIAKHAESPLMLLRAVYDKKLGLLLAR